MVDSLRYRRAFCYIAMVLFVDAHFWLDKR